MHLSEFLRTASQPILSDWDEFASRALPATARGGSRDLRDSLNRLLEAIAEDMESIQSDDDQSQKGKGLRPENAPHVTEVGQAHAADRFAAGYNVNQLVAEYRALRASVLRHWTANAVQHSAASFIEMVRFNEAIDQSLTESVAWYSARHERARDLFIGVLGHDLRNPLGAANMSATALMKSERLAADHLKAVVRIFNATVRMKTMIEDLLDFTRARMGTGLPVDVRPVDLSFVASQVVDEIHAAYPARAIDLRVSGDLHGVWDAPRLSQMLSNLVGNSIQHGLPDSPVSLTLRGDDGASVVLAVQNIGPPIAPEALPFIFDLLVRGAVKESEDKGRTGGLGLGLYIAHHIALAHGGSISAESSSEAGTTFTVTLPRKSRLDERTSGAQADDGGTASRRARRASRSSGFDST